MLIKASYSKKNTEFSPFSSPRFTNIDTEKINMLSTQTFEKKDQFYLNKK